MSDINSLVADALMQEGLFDKIKTGVQKMTVRKPAAPFATISAPKMDLVGARRGHDGLRRGGRFVPTTA